jgi:hypothetical protein
MQTQAFDLRFPARNNANDARTKQYNFARVMLRDGEDVQLIPSDVDDMEAACGLVNMGAAVIREHDGYYFLRPISEIKLSQWLNSIE